MAEDYHRHAGLKTILATGLTNLMLFFAAGLPCARPTGTQWPFFPGRGEAANDPGRLGG
jgi:hypothetical protein